MLADIPLRSIVIVAELGLRQCCIMLKGDYIGIDVLVILQKKPRKQGILVDYMGYRSAQ